jgi:nucleoside-diphosphate-sugar epimerase
MNVLVIGGTGYLSGPVVRQLQSAGHAVTIFTRGQRPAPAGVEVIRGDRRDGEALVARFAGSRYDAVVDCICYRAEEAEADVAAFGGSGAHLVMISTDFVYGPERQLPMVEETPRKALSSYGRQKAQCEDLLLAACREGRLAVTVLRPPHIMGPGGQLGGGSLQGRDPMLLDRLRRGVPLVLLDSGSLLIQPVVHDDVGRAAAAVLGRSATVGEAYNVAGPDVVTVRGYYEVIALALGQPLAVRSLPAAVYAAAWPEKAPFAYHRTYDVSKLEQDAGYRPGTDFEYAVFSMMDWLQANAADRPYEPSALDTAALELCAGFEAAAGRLLAETD